MGWLLETLQKLAMYIVSQVICIPFLKKPFQDLSHPGRRYAIENAINVRIKVGKVKKGEEIGGWFMQPSDTNDRPLPKTDDEQFEERTMENEFLVKENESTILYLHGNAETRAQYHRRALYKIFQDMGYHVLAIDYRGYGDSSKQTPSQTSMVEDGHAAFHWIQKHSHPSSSIFIWGHSLGTGVTSKLAHVLTHSEDNNSETNKLSGIFLEAPFNRMLDEVKEFRLSRILPWIGIDIGDTLDRADMSFDSTFWLKSVNIPILIMHAEDDKVIPFHLASKMYDELKKAGVNVNFHSFSRQEQLGHDGIFKAKTPRLLSDIVSEFVTKVLE